MSHGLEGLWQAKIISKRDTLEVLQGLLLYSVAPADGAALVLAHASAAKADWQQVMKIDRYLYASKLNAEMRRASVRSGRQLATMIYKIMEDAPGFANIARWKELVDSKETPGCQPISTAIANQANGVNAEEAVAADLFAFAASYAGAALRMRLVSHETAQLLLRQVSPTIEEATFIACHTPMEEIGGFVPVADVASGKHEKAEARLFTT